MSAKRVNIHPAIADSSWIKSESAIAHWSRPYMVRRHSKFCSGAFMFDSMGDAIDYLRQQNASASDVLDLDHSVVIGPDGQAIQARFALI